MNRETLLVTKGTPREVKATLERCEIQIMMTDVELRMLRLSMKCQDRARGVR